MGCLGPRHGFCLLPPFPSPSPPHLSSLSIPPLPFLFLSRRRLTLTPTNKYNPLHTTTTTTTTTTTCLIPKFRPRASVDEGQFQISLTSDKDVEESVRVLKNAAKTRKVPAGEILQAFSVIENAKLDPSGFFQTLGGSESPGRTWMLIYTAEKKLARGKYFPITAVQRFDAVGKRIENGVYLGPLGSLTFEGRLSWNKRILTFVFEQIRVKIGPLGPLKYSFKGDDIKEPSNKDPFFIWFYVDEEIAVARGRSGGTAFWVRCNRIAN